MTLFLSNAIGKAYPLDFGTPAVIQNTDDMKAAAKYVHMMSKKDGYSRAKNSKWEWSDCIYGDIDGGMTLDEFQRRYDPYEYYLVTSQSHQKGKDGRPPEDRFHVYFPIAKTHDAEMYHRNLKRLATTEGFDGNVQDIARQFFGSPAEIVLHNEGIPITEYLNNKSDYHGIPDAPAKNGSVPMNKMVEGSGRNGKLFSLCCLFVKTAKDLPEYVQMSKDANNNFGVPLDDDECAGVMTRAYAHGLGKEAEKFILKDKIDKGPYLDEKIYTAKEMSEMVKTDIGNRDTRPKPIPTGFKDFDKAMSGGFRQKDFCIVAAFTSDGKSTLLMNFAVTAARAGKKVGILSLEEDILRLGGRITSNLTHINQTLIFNPPDNPQTISAGILNGLDRLSKLDIVVNHSPGMFVDDVERMADRMITEHGIEMLVIDYLQMLRIKGDKEIRERVGDIVIRLTSLARFRGIVLITASQLNRAGADNPTLTNLSESSKIEHQADHVFIITAKTEDNGSGPIRTPNAIRLVKNRQGPKNISVMVKLDGDSMTFREVKGGNYDR